MATFGTKQWFRDMLSELLTEKKTYVQTNSANATLNTSVQTLSWHTPVSVKGDIKLSIKLPTRHNGNDWGGLYVTPVLTITKPDFSRTVTLGNEGYAGGIMALSASSVGEHTQDFYINTLWLGIADKNEVYSVKVELKVKSYSGTAIINDNHDINKILDINGGLTIQADLAKQNYSSIVIEEIGEVIT